MDVEIRFTDGTFETLYNVVREDMDRNSAVVTFWTDGGWSRQVPLGSFPVVNIQKWRKIEK